MTGSVPGCGWSVIECAIVRGVVPDWLVPFVAAMLAILVLNLALLAQRRRTRHQSWSERLLRELRSWDGRLPDELNRTEGSG